MLLIVKINSKLLLTLNILTLFSLAVVIIKFLFLEESKKCLMHFISFENAQFITFLFIFLIIS